MIKEELKQEAEEYFKNLDECKTKEMMIDAYVTGALPREKQIEKLGKENAEYKEKISYLKDNLRVARKDRENLQLAVAKGLKEFVKDFPATAIRYLANKEYVERLTQTKEIIEELLKALDGRSGFNEDVFGRAEQFLKDLEK